MDYARKKDKGEEFEDKKLPGVSKKKHAEFQGVD